MGGVGRLIGTTAAATALVMLLASFLATAAMAGGDDGATYFRLNLSVDGGYTVDYGEPPGPNNSDYSGAATTSYSTEIVTVARYRRGEEEIGDNILNSKTRVNKAETTSVVSHFPGSEPTAFECDNGRTGQRSGTAPGSPDDDLPQGVSGRFVRDIGAVGISGGPGDSKEISFGVRSGFYLDADCFDSGHSPVEHYLHSPDTDSIMLGDQSIVPCCVIPRGAFNPNSDGSYGDSFSRNVHFEPGSNPRPESPEFPNHPGSDPTHIFDGASQVSFKIKKIREGKANRLRKKIHNLPDGEEHEGELRAGEHRR